MSTHPASSLPAVAVIGAGAVGCYYGAMLARAGVPVTLVGRPAHVEAMRRDGLRLSTATFDECVPVRADTDMAAAAGASLVLVCVKSTDTADAAAQLAPHLAPGACVLSLQNG
ncbi:MAG TPA: 2-dehydropantoate 2-reductase, partial [Burkholderiaceae bacterium]